jgi:PleD family two-component response regulator
MEGDKMADVGEKTRVLLANKEKGEFAELKNYLTEAGFAVAIATSVDMYNALVRQCDIIVADLNILVMVNDDPDTTLVTKSLEKTLESVKIPTIITTSHFYDAGVSENMVEKFDHVYDQISKPYRTKQVVRWVKRLQEGKK